MPTWPGMDFDTVADELYGLRPEEFTSARDRAASEARAAGERDLAAAIKRLKRPSASAAMINQLARQRRPHVDRLLDVASRLRDAHARLAGADLRSLSQERQQLVAALVQEARSMTQEAGQRSGTAVMREVQETLEAAVADPEAGAALRAGRLASALSYSGLGSPVGPEGGLASGDDAAASATRDEARTKEAQAVLTAARHRVSEAEAALSGADTELARARRLSEDLRAQLSELEARVLRTEGRMPALRAELEAAREAEREAEAALGS